MTNKKDFIENFTREFLASWAGSNYDEYCSYGLSTNLVDSPPLEDAEFIAQEIYNKLFPTEEIRCAHEERIAQK